MLVRSLKGANGDSSVSRATSPSIISARQHLATLTHSHDCCSTTAIVNSTISRCLVLGGVRTVNQGVVQVIDTEFHQQKVGPVFLDSHHLYLPMLL